MAATKKPQVVLDLVKDYFTRNGAREITPREVHEWIDLRRHADGSLSPDTFQSGGAVRSAINLLEEKKFLELTHRGPVRYKLKCVPPKPTINISTTTMSSHQFVLMSLLESGQDGGLEPIPLALAPGEEGRLYPVCPHDTMVCTACAETWSNDWEIHYSLTRGGKTLRRKLLSYQANKSRGLKYTFNRTGKSEVVKSPAVDLALITEAENVYFYNRTHGEGPLRCKLAYALIASQNKNFNHVIKKSSFNDDWLVWREAEFHGTDYAYKVCPRYVVYCSDGNGGLDQMTHHEIRSLLSS
jgi:hypothetical protein